MLAGRSLEGAGCAWILAFPFVFACSAADDAPTLSERPQTVGNAPVKENPPSLSSAASSASSSANGLPIGHPGPPYPIGTRICNASPYKKPADYVGVWPPPASQWWGLKLKSTGIAASGTRETRGAKTQRVALKRGGVESRGYGVWGFLDDALI